MLDEADKPGKEEEEDAMIVFQDSKGQVWELIKRDDFENFNELIETAEDEEAAGIYSKKLIKDKEVSSPVKAGTNIHSHLHSFEEE